MATLWKSMVVLHETVNAGVTLAVGLQVPTDGAVGFAPGCLFILYNETNAFGSLYVNTTGTQHASLFRLVPGLPLNYDCQRTTAAGKTIGYVNPNNYDSVNQANEDASAGDVITLGVGTFNMIYKIIMTPGVIMRGASKEATIINGTWRKDITYPGEIEPQPGISMFNNNVLSDMTITCAPVNFNDDTIAVGYNPNAGPGTTCTIRRVSITCPDWAIYGWNSNVGFLVEDCDIHCGRQCLAFDDSGLGTNAIVRRCQLYATAANSMSTAAGVSNPTYGHVCGISHRAGSLKVYDTEFYTIGAVNSDGSVDAGHHSYAPYSCGISNGFYYPTSGPGPSTWEIRNCHFNTNPNGCTVANSSADVRTVAGEVTLVLLDGDGSGSSNAITKLLV